MKGLMGIEHRGQRSLEDGRRVSRTDTLAQRDSRAERSGPPADIPPGRTAALLSAVLIAGLCLRIFRLNHEFLSSDDVSIPLYVFDSIPRDLSLQRWLTIDNGAMGNPLRLIGYPLGALLPAVLWAVVLLYSELGVPITEVTLAFVPLAFGILGIGLTYVVTRSLSTRGAGIIAAALLAVTPIHVIESRSLAASWTLSLVLQLSVIAALVGAIRRRSRRLEWVFAALLALYALTDNQFLCLFPMIPYSVYRLSDSPSGTRGRLADAAEWLRRRWTLFLPAALVLVVLVGLHFVFCCFVVPAVSGVDTGVGSLSHIWKRETRPGFYAGGLLVETRDNLGLPLLAFTALSLAGLRGEGPARRERGKRVLLVWGLCYLLPFVLFISPDTTVTRGYLSAGLYPLIMLAAINFHEYLVRAKTRRRAIVLAATGSAIFISTCLLSLSAALRITVVPALELRPFQGSYAPMEGMKAAGWWLREHTPAGATVYVFGAKVKVARLYSGRRCVGSLALEDPYATGFSWDAVRSADYVIGFREQKSILEQLGFHEALTVTAGVEPLLSVFAAPASASAAPGAVLDVEAGRRAFDARYSRLSAFRATPRYVSSDRSVP